MEILVIEDDADLAVAVRDTLTDAGHHAVLARTGREGLAHACGGGFDVVIMDRLLPGGVDGIGLLLALRLDGFNAPVIFASAMASVDDRVRGLRAGADDYLSKPFSSDELLARVEALGRRGQARRGEETLACGPLSLDIGARLLRKGEGSIAVNPQEARLMEFLLRRKGQLVTAEQLLNAAWPSRFDPSSNVVEAHISRLRRKLEALHEADFITTIRGGGYLVRPEDQHETSLN